MFFVVQVVLVLTLQATLINKREIRKILIWKNKCYQNLNKNLSNEFYNKSKWGGIKWH